VRALVIHLKFAEGARSPAPSICGFRTRGYDEEVLLNRDTRSRSLGWVAQSPSEILRSRKTPLAQALAALRHADMATACSRSGVGQILSDAQIASNIVCRAVKGTRRSRSNQPSTERAFSHSAKTPHKSEPPPALGTSSRCESRGSHIATGHNPLCSSFLRRARP
jgi:hypothetical protein